MGEYYDLVPKDYDKNLAYRSELLDEAIENPSVREELWIACSRDLLFYINMFGWTYDPRKANGVLPFITYKFQDESMRQIRDCILDGRDLVIKKSRDMGASWMLLTVFEWFWHFKDGQSFLLVSRNEDYVDKTGNPKALFWKIDFIHKHLPNWLIPNITRTKLRLTNEDNGSSIDGESTTGDVARGDRRTAIGLDEFAAFEVDSSYRALASTRDATRCRIFNSTPAGSSNAFYDIAHSDGFEQLGLHWSLHPEKAEGLYEQGGKIRSPWYDAECKRCAHSQEIAQELDIDFAGSDYQFFDSKMLTRQIAEFAKPPMKVGDVQIHQESCTVMAFHSAPKGRLRLWFDPGAASRVPTDGPFALGVDIATGTGSSNSVISIGNCKTGEKVAEFVDSRTRPEELGRIAVALARWFSDANGKGAYIVWEAPGPGRNFGDTVIESGYRNFYFKEDDAKLRKGSGSRIPGWWPTKDNKRALYAEYRDALANGRFLNRSKDALSECREIVYTAHGWIQHSKTNSSMDPSGARENHGDRPTADALLNLGMKSKVVKQGGKETVVSEGSLAWRRREYETRRRRVDYW
ncbi:MAG: putative terminase large subunit [Prokaryotic dsDNA virus sp.]|nr:MAG: putative terminase large subunit [Prokaryotic dsDNA virus sp.]